VTDAAPRGVRGGGPVGARYAEAVPAGRDDDALTWDGDDDPTLDVRAADQTEPAPSADDVTTLPEGYTAVGRGSETVAAADSPAAEPGARSAGPDTGASDDDGDDNPPLGNAALIALGVLGGFSVLFALGWLIGGLRLQGTAEFLVAPLAYQISLWLAVIAPIVWFATVLVLTRGRRLWVRFAWLVGGVVLLVPWPFIMVGVIGR
jgi:hypothetical protein